MNLARIYLARARSLQHLQTRSQRHAWVRAKLRFPAPRVAISQQCVLRADDYRFARTMADAARVGTRGVE